MVPVNKQVVSNIQKKIIRKMFFQKIKMKEIEKKTKLTERVIRRIIREKNWSAIRERYYRMLCRVSLKTNTPLEKLAHKTGVNYYGLCRIRKKYKIPKAKRIAWNDRRTDNLEQEVVDLYKNGKTGKEISVEFGYKRKETVYQILEKHEVERRESKIQTYYDEEFFEQIDTHEKAYILGLIMTDGNIIKDYNGFEIQLTKEDGYILEKISNLIGASKTHPLQKINCDAKRRQEGFENAKDMVRLTVHNRKIAESLKKLGVVKNKTKIMRYNGCVPDDFLSSFFRGLIDGDGTVGIYNNESFCCKLYSESFEFINDIDINILPFEFSITNKGRLLNVLGGKKTISNFWKWIYNSKGDFYLRRKYEKVQSQIN